MTELTAMVQTLTPDPTLVGPRDLTSHEHADLDRLRAPLAGSVDRTDSRALSWFWDRVVPQPGTAAPAGLVEWVGVALGDLLVTHVAGSRWVVCPGPSGPTLGIVGDAHPLAPVVPIPDAQDRWDAGARGWIGGYLGAAAAHLAGVTMPQPRVSVENVTASERTTAPASAPVDDEPSAPADSLAASLAEAGIVPDAAPAAAEAEAEATEWTPVVVPAPGTPLPSRHHAPADGTAAAAAGAAPTADPGPGAARPAAAAPAPVQAAPVQPPAVQAAAVQPAPVQPAAVQPTAVQPTAPRRPTNLPHPPSTAAQELALRALEHALVVLRRGPFDREAFVMLVDESGTRTLACTGEPSQALRQARDTARTSDARAVAIGWIDRHPAGIPDPRQGFPAVLIEASEAGAPGLKVAHRFVEDALGTGPLGDPVLVGEVPPLL
ncbi:hypothetical protein [Cellulomonas sp. 73-145]|uniref:hypothetical protein n=1 Tax=Cellulomonas sp. 73-145 TaxID=1895739 RepID=UPI001ACC202E|nr:hypothetical protein [Cellulomonas sp. 73-145]MBN9328530.1 hypothetical protein [Cellulomonas sp.]